MERTGNCPLLLPGDFFAGVLEGCWTMIERRHTNIEEFAIVLPPHTRYQIQNCVGARIGVDICIITPEVRLYPLNFWSAFPPDGN